MAAAEGNPRSWAPYSSYRDCSQGICTVYCPQWCYIIFPPPPFEPKDHDSGASFSPLIIVIIGILASAFLLISYYTIITKYCRRRGDQRTSAELDPNQDQLNQDQWQLAPAGLDEALIKSITVFKYKKGDGLIEGSDCAVCLSEFKEDENLRLMPNCDHAFHPPCIDTWLKSHSNCPLCRSNVGYAKPTPPPVTVSQNSSTVNVSSLEIHRQNDVMLVVDDVERGHLHRIVSVVDNCDAPKNPFDGDQENSELRQNIIFGQEGAQQLRRSLSLDSSSSQQHLLVFDILQVKEDDGELHQIKCMGIGSSRSSLGGNSNSNYRSRGLEQNRSPCSLRRSISTGRFMFTRQEKGNISIPNL